MKAPRHLAPARAAFVVAASGLLLFAFNRALYALLKHRLPSADLASGLWGLMILGGFAGWGGALEAIVSPRRRADWGLRLAWGWGVVVALGGVLCAIGLARRAMLIGVAWSGLMLLTGRLTLRLGTWASSREPLIRRRRMRLYLADGRFFTAAAGIFALSALRAYGSVSNATFNANDDSLAYLPFAREILERGTLTQPFSLRRISAYDGKSLLDALQLAIDVPDRFVYNIDKGLATLTILALICGLARLAPRADRTILLLGMLFVAAMPDTGINTSTMRTGTVFFLGLYRTMTFYPVAGSRSVRASVPVAILAAGACTLRQNFLATIGAQLVIAYGAPIVASVRVRPLRVDKGAVLDAARTAGLLAVFLSPWWVLAQRWCGTILFPLLKGNYNPAYSFFPGHTVREWMKYVWVQASYASPIKAVPLFLLAALMMRDGNPRRPLTASVVGAFFGFLFLVYGYPAADAPNQSRYYFGFASAAILAIILATSELAPRQVRAPRERSRQSVSMFLVMAGMCLQLFEDREITSRNYRAALEQIAMPIVPWVAPSPDPIYASLQAAVPEGAPIATMVDEPSQFDFRRNRIACLDMIGAVSPPPGIPLAAGAEAVAAYLVAAGYRYVVVVSPDTAASLYRRDVWVKQQAETVQVWKDSAHFYLEAFDAFGELRKTRVHLAENGSMVTLDLQTLRR